MVLESFYSDWLLHPWFGRHCRTQRPFVSSTLPSSAMRRRPSGTSWFERLWFTKSSLRLSFGSMRRRLVCPKNLGTLASLLQTCGAVIVDGLMINGVMIAGGGTLKSMATMRTTVTTSLILPLILRPVNQVHLLTVLPLPLATIQDADLYHLAQPDLLQVTKVSVKPHTS